MTTAVLRSAQAGAVLTSLSVGGARHVTMPLASATQVALARLTRILLLVAVALCLGAPTAAAVPVKKLDNNLGEMWTTILQTPKAQNPFFTGGGCYNLGGTVAPFGAAGFNVGVHGKARHQDIRCGLRSRVQHVRGEWDD